MLRKAWACFRSIIGGAADLVRGFLETIWWAGPPVDWDEQCEEALGDDEDEGEQVPWEVGRW